MKQQSLLSFFSRSEGSGQPLKDITPPSGHSNVFSKVHWRATSNAKPRAQSTVGNQGAKEASTCRTRKRVKLSRDPVQTGCKGEPLSLPVLSEEPKGLVQVPCNAECGLAAENGAAGTGPTAAAGGSDLVVTSGHGLQHICGAEKGLRTPSPPQAAGGKGIAGLDNEEGQVPVLSVESRAAVLGPTAGWAGEDRTAPGAACPCLTTKDGVVGTTEVAGDAGQGRGMCGDGADEGLDDGGKGNRKGRSGSHAGEEEKRNGGNSSDAGVETGASGRSAGKEDRSSGGNWFDAGVEGNAQGATGSDAVLEDGGEDRGQGGSVLPVGVEGTPGAHRACEAVNEASDGQSTEVEEDEPESGSEDSESDPNHLCSYERQRLENIKRNEAFLASLGIKPLTLPPPKPKRPVKKKVALVRPAERPSLRRSTRSRIRAEVPRAASDDARLAGIADGTLAGRREVSAEEQLEFQDSLVMEHINVPPEVPLLAEREATRAGLVEMGEEYSHPNLTRVYSIDCFRGLVVAGGHQGWLAVFGMSSCKAGAGEGGRHIGGVGTNEFGGQEREAQDSRGQEQGGLGAGSGRGQPLLSWRGGHSWISGAQFLTEHVVQQSTLLLTTSNDSSVVLWDVNKAATSSKGQVIPQVVFETDLLHSGGVFGMHERGARLLTASKDSSVVLSRVAATGIQLERRITGHHGGVIKGVHFRDSHVFADCGADCSVCVLDLRCHEACVITLEGAHDCAVNNVEWHPINEHILLSASQDPSLRLHDIRLLGQPVVSLLSGHILKSRAKNIYRPAFVVGGSCIACPGEGSNAITLYSTSTGVATQRVVVGYDATTVTLRQNESLHERLWAVGPKGVVRPYLPKWVERT